MCQRFLNGGISSAKLDKNRVSIFPLSITSLSTDVFAVGMHDKPNAGFMLDHRLRRWSNIKSALVQCIVATGKVDTMTPRTD